MIGGVTPWEGTRASPACRWYGCKEGRIWVGSQEESQWRALAKALGRPELAYPGSWEVAKRAPPRGRLGRLLERLFRADPAEVWVERLDAAGVPCRAGKAQS